MANTLTNLIPTIYDALDVVSREQVGLIPAVTRNTGLERVAVGQSVLVPITPRATLVDVTPSVTPPSGGDQVVTSKPIALTKSKAALVTWNGEQQLGVRNAGTYDSILRDQFAQGFRELTNAIEADIWAAAYQGASRAYGTPGTAPFGTVNDLSDTATLRKILTDNGAPQDDRHLVLGSSAVLNLEGKQTILLKANENGDDGEFRRSGVIAREKLNGFALHESAAIVPVTKGTGASYVTSGSTAVGVNSIALVTGTGTVNPGDIVTFAADSANKYVVNGGVAAPGTITIGEPGALKVIPTANAMSLGADYTPNVGFHRSAIILVARPPARPLGPDGRPMDLAQDSMLVTDPYSGLTFEIAVYPGYNQLTYHIRLAWGVAAIKPAHICTLIG